MSGDVELRYYTRGIIQLYYTTLPNYICIIQHEIETGTAIMFNSKQLDHQIAITRDTKLSKWMQQLCHYSGYEVELKEDPVDEDKDVGGGSIDEFDHVDISEGVDGMHDEDMFEAEEVMDKSNIYEWGGLSVV